MPHGGCGDCIQIPKQVAVEVHGNKTAPLVLLMIKKRIVVMTSHAT